MAFNNKLGQQLSLLMSIFDFGEDVQLAVEVQEESQRQWAQSIFKNRSS